MLTTVKPRPCDHCEKPFVPARMGQRVCSLRCAGAVGRAEGKAKRRAEREKDKAKREALKKLTKLIAEAQFQFNKFIRQRDFAKGCFVCHRPFLQDVSGRAIHAGHVRSRGAAGHLRFNEDNCHGECEGCNGPRGAKPHEIEAGAIERIGQERYDALKADNTPHKWQKDELRAIRDEYRRRLKDGA